MRPGVRFDSTETLPKQSDIGVKHAAAIGLLAVPGKGCRCRQQARRYHEQGSIYFYLGDCRTADCHAGTGGSQVWNWEWEQPPNQSPRPLGGTMSKRPFVFMLVILALLTATQAQAGSKLGIGSGSNRQSNHHGH